MQIIITPRPLRVERNHSTTVYRYCRAKINFTGKNFLLKFIQVGCGNAQWVPPSLGTLLMLHSFQRMCSQGCQIKVWVKLFIQLTHNSSVPTTTGPGRLRVSEKCDNNYSSFLSKPFEWVQMHLTFQLNYLAFKTDSTWKVDMQQEMGCNSFIRSLEDCPSTLRSLNNLNLLCNHTIHLGSLYIRAWVESFNLQIWRRWCLDICQDFIHLSNNWELNPSSSSQ